MSRLLPALLGGSRSSASAWTQPLLDGVPARFSSTLSADDVHDEAPPVDESWWAEVQAGAADGGDGDGEQQRQPRRHQNERLDAPIDVRRSLKDYQKMVLALTRRKRAYLIRDVVDEMSLSGIRPDKFVLQTGLFACMKNRKLGDAMWFFEEMKRRGMEIDSVVYGIAISACGRTGQLSKVRELQVDMERRGLPMTHNIRLALLNSYAEAGKLAATQEMFDQVAASGHPSDEFAFAALANCYRHMAPRARPADVDQQLLGLLTRFKEARAASEAATEAARESYVAPDEQPEAHFEPRGGDRALYTPLLVVFNAVLNSLVELGHHEAAVSLYQRIREEGLAPDHTTYCNIIRSHIVQALGRHRQPENNKLTALLDERLLTADLSADVEAVLAEDASLAAALQAAVARAGKAAAAAADAATADATAAEGAAAEAAAADARGSAANADLPAGETSDAAGTAAGTELPAAGAAEAEGAMEEGVEQQAGAAVLEDGAAAGSAHTPQQQQQQQQHGSGGQGGQQPWAGMGEKELRNVARTRAANRARSRLRFALFREYLDVDSWYQALYLFQEVLDQGLKWGPDITYSMLKAALDLQAAGVEDSMEVAHTVMDTFDRQGLFMDVPNGTEVLLLAVRRDVADLSLAHRVYDSMRKTERVPKTPCLYKYMRALVQREPESLERLLDVCTRITSDPDKSEQVVNMKHEAYQRRHQLQKQLGISPRQQQQLQQQQQQRVRQYPHSQRPRQH